VTELTEAELALLTLLASPGKRRIAGMFTPGEAGESLRVKGLVELRGDRMVLSNDGIHEAVVRGIN
jgi:hypothetical protein